MGAAVGATVGAAVAAGVGAALGANVGGVVGAGLAVGATPLHAATSTAQTPRATREMAPMLPGIFAAIAVPSRLISANRRR